MIIEIAVCLIAFALIVSTIYLIFFLLKTGKILDATKKDLHDISTEAIGLMHTVDELVTDIQSKSDSLDIVFRPLKSIRKSRLGGNETISEIVDWIMASLFLFNKIKHAVKRREK